MDTAKLKKIMAEFGKHIEQSRALCNEIQAILNESDDDQTKKRARGKPTESAGPKAVTIEKTPATQRLYSKQRKR